MGGPALGFFASRHLPSRFATGLWIGVACGAAVAVALAVREALRAGRDRRRPRRREASDAVDFSIPPGGIPYRVMLVRTARAASPKASARGTAVALGIAFVATASLAPAALKMPPRIEAEWVIAGWWALGAAALATLIYRGAHVVDDHELVFRGALPSAGHRSTEGRRRVQSAPNGASWGDPSGWIEPSGCTDFSGDGCAGILAGVALVLAVYVASLVVVDFVAPLLFFLFYTAVLRATRHVTTRHVASRGRLGAAVAQGAIWAAVYVLPLTVLVRLIHAALHAPSG
jgi:hypothetical protein